MIGASFLIFGSYPPVVTAHALKNFESEGNISLSYNVAGVKMPDESEKEAMKIAKSVTQNIFKALQKKQYRIAYNYFGPELQSQVSYQQFVDHYSNTTLIGLEFCDVFDYEGNLIIIDGQYEQIERTADGKIDPRLFRFRFAVNKIGNDWKVVELIEEDVTLKHL